MRSPIFSRYEHKYYLWIKICQTCIFPCTWNVILISKAFYGIGFYSIHPISFTLKIVFGTLILFKYILCQKILRVRQNLYWLMVYYLLYWQTKSITQTRMHCLQQYSNTCAQCLHFYAGICSKRSLDFRLVIQPIYWKRVDSLT